MTVKLQWATPDIDKQILFMARASNPKGQDSENSRQILRGVALITMAAFFSAVSA
jgi:hypothetical protein